MNRCIGCGAILQTKDKDKIGYIPEEKVNDAKLCERCFRILHYNDLKIVDLPKAKEVLSIINKKGNFAFFLVDLLNINLEVLSTYKNIEIPKCLIISKADFIPKYINKNNIKIWLKEEYGIEEEIIFLSAVKNQNISAISNILESKCLNKAYLLGYTNSGKSTLVNCLKNDNSVTTSLVPNTTIDFINVKLDNNITLIDSPGFLYEENLYEKDDLLFIKKVNPKTFIKPITFQLKKGASIVIEDKIRIENKSEKCNMTLYMSNLLDIKKIYDKNELLKNLENVNIRVKKNQDIVIKGIGFINCKSNAELNVYIKGQNFIEVRNSFFGR